MHNINSKQITHKSFVILDNVPQSCWSLCIYQQLCNSNFYHSWLTLLDWQFNQA